jgi:hypothetical protein
MKGVIGVRFLGSPPPWSMLEVALPGEQSALNVAEAAMADLTAKLAELVAVH